ncbi:MAG: pyridoxamine 5'-phosphate oxidase family protein [Clostridia bacterium]|nr:pyridoxamine 5'-phosphate oxidase family protein [Clostridia bacterium]
MSIPGLFRGTPARKRVRKIFTALCGAVLAVLVFTAFTRKEAAPMTNHDFFRSLDFDDGLRVVTETFDRFPLQYGTTLGLDGNPQIRPIEFKFEQDGVLYFDTVEFYRSYAELQAHPYLQLCVCDPETMTYVRVGGKVNFTKDPAIVDRCFAESPVLTSQFGERRDVVVAYYLTEVWAEFNSFTADLPYRSYQLPNRFDAAAAEANG